MDITLLAEAAQRNGFSLYGLVIEGVCLVQDFVDSLPDADQVQIFSLFEHIRNNGPPKNEHKFRPLGDGIYELKTANGVRILSFFAPAGLRRSLILTHGFAKPKPKILKREKRRAFEWHNGTDDIRIV
jgi:phage-related protein